MGWNMSHSVGWDGLTVCRKTDANMALLSVKCINCTHTEPRALSHACVPKHPVQTQTEPPKHSPSRAVNSTGSSSSEWACPYRLLFQLSDSCSLSTVTLTNNPISARSPSALSVGANDTLSVSKFLHRLPPHLPILPHLVLLLVSVPALLNGGGGDGCSQRSKKKKRGVAGGGVRGLRGRRGSHSICQLSWEKYTQPWLVEHFLSRTSVSDIERLRVTCLQALWELCEYSINPHLLKMRTSGSGGSGISSENLLQKKKKN